MATQPYYYNKKGEIRSNEFSLQKHKPSCRLSLAESIDQLEQVESGEILPKDATMSQTIKQHSVSPRGERLMSSVDRRAQYHTQRITAAHGSSLFPSKTRKPLKNQYQYVESKLKRLSLFPSDSRAKFERFLNEDLEFASPKQRDVARSSLYIDSHTSLMKRRYPGRQSGIHHQNLSLDHAPSFIMNQRFVTVILNGPNPTAANLNRTVVLLKSSRPFDPKKGGPGNSSLLHKQRQFREFLVQCTKLLGLNRLLKHVFLPSGQQLYSLDEVPQNAEKLYVSHLAYFFSGMASPRPTKKEDLQNKITNLERAKLIQGASHRKVIQAQTPSLEQIMPLSADIREEDAPQQASNLSLMIRDLVSRQRKDIAQAEELYTKKRNIREIIKKSSNDAQLQFQLRSIQDQEEMRSAHGSPTVFSRNSQNRDQQAQTVDQDSGDIISSNHPKETALSIATSEVYYPNVNIKRKAADNKFAQYIQSQSQKGSSLQGSKRGGASTSVRLGSNYSRKYQADSSEDQYEGEFQDSLFDRELYNSRNRHKSVRNEVIRQQCTQEEMMEQMSRESQTRQQILSSAFNSIRLKLEINRNKQEREEIRKAAQNVGEILSRNHNTLTLSNGSEWLAIMIERIQRGDRVMDMLSDARSSDTEESADRSPVRHSLINNAKALRKVLIEYKEEMEFKIEPHSLEKQASQEIKDFVQINKEKFNQSGQARSVEKRIGSIVTQNIPKLQLRSNFSRRELHALHSQFKTLCRISLAKHPQIIKKVEKNELAIDIQTFISCARGIMNFGFHQDETLSRIFHTFDSDQNGVMDWEEFLLTMKLMTTNKIEQRVGLFFKAAERTYGPSLDFKAIVKLCQQSLARYMKIKSKDPVMEDLVLFFASYIFESLEYEKTSRIPIKVIQEAIFTSDDQKEKDDLKDMLLLFSCSDD